MSKYVRLQIFGSTKSCLKHLLNSCFLSLRLQNVKRFNKNNIFLEFISTLSSLSVRIMLLLFVSTMVRINKCIKNISFFVQPLCFENNDEITSEFNEKIVHVD